MVSKLSIHLHFALAATNHARHAAMVRKPNLIEALDGLIEETGIDNFVRACSEPSSALKSPKTTLLFVRFREDSPDIRALVEFLWLVAINYVIPLHKRQLAIEQARKSKGGANLLMINRLREETKRAFIEFNAKYPQRASEVGELLAYCIALRYLGAAQIASKMALKTSGNMPIHGLDGVHAKFAGGMMTVYFLESKTANSASSGAADMAKSVSDFASNRKQYLREYTIVDDFGNLNSLDKAQRALALEYLDPYGKKKSQRLERTPPVPI